MLNAAVFITLVSKIGAAIICLMLEKFVISKLDMALLKYSD